jgi:hypothetical protein
VGRQIDLYSGSSDPDVAPEIQMLRLASGHVPAQAVHVFASLGIADLLHDGPKTADEIADLVGAHAPALYRVLRFLSTLGVVCERENGHFTLMPLGRTLRSQSVSAIRDNALLVGSSFYWKSLGNLLDQVITGKNAFRTAYRESRFEYLGGHPKDAALFNASMDSLSKATVPAILAAYDFSGFRRVVDIGGGKGSLLTGILKRYPSVHGVLYDSATVIDSTVVDRAVASRLERVAGNFFESVPVGGDAYILRQILHEWDDERAIQILSQCRRVISNSGKLLIIEMAAPGGKNSGNNWAALDLLMMILLSGRERTLAEFEDILRLAGLSIGRVVSTTSPFNIIEATLA